MKNRRWRAHGRLLVEVVTVLGLAGGVAVHQKWLWLDLEPFPELYTVSVEMVCLYLTAFQRLKEDLEQGVNTHH